MKAQFDNLKKEFQKGDLTSVASLLKTLKLELVSNKCFLQPGSQQDLLMASKQSNLKNRRNFGNWGLSFYTGKGYSCF